ncbi:MAG: hypothetical protein E7582_04760 [Ruminococcaceae bacterium]|nr:hypothetical protein [Oscillospiraceae bacterium]
MSDKYYILNLYDPATPGFCSFSKLYIGTQAEILKAIKNLEVDSDSNNTAKAVKEYFNGNTAATHNVAYQEVPVLTPIEIIAEHGMELNHYKWTHINMWGFPYYMKCDRARVHQIVFEHDGMIHRFVRGWFDNLSYKGDFGDWSELKDGFWGNAAILDVTTYADNFTFNNLLYVKAENYESAAGAIDDLQKKNKLEFRSICDEIFADG